MFQRLLQNRKIIVQKFAGLENNIYFCHRIENKTSRMKVMSNIWWWRNSRL